MFAYSNPPTKEYMTYYNEIKSRAATSGSDYLIFLNPMRQKDVNPLAFIDVMHYSKLIYPNYVYSNKKFNNPIDILRHLSKEYTNIVFMTTADNKESYANLGAYAEKLGVVTFNIEVLKKSKVYNKIARDSVNDNDFTTFLTCFDNKNKALLSKLFITMRKAMSLSERISNIKPTLFYEAIMENKMQHDKLNNRYVEVGKYRITELPNTRSVKVGIVEGKKTLFVPSISLESCIDNIHLLENIATTSSSNIATTPVNMGNTIKYNVDIKNVIKNNDDLVSAMRYCVNTYGIINSDIIRNLRQHYDKV